MKRVKAWLCPRCGLLSRDSVVAYTHDARCDAARSRVCVPGHFEAAP